MGVILDRIANILQSRGIRPQQTFSYTDIRQPLDVDVDDTDQQLRNDIENAVRQYKSELPSAVQEAMATLGVDRNSTADQLRYAFKSAIKKWHPDLFVSHSQSEQENAATKTREITAAYILLQQYFSTRNTK